MTDKTLTAWCLISLTLIVFPLCASAAHAGEVYVVAADSYGLSNYLQRVGNGSLSAQEPLGQIDANVQGYSFGGALGDFDNDGDFDYVTAKGYRTGSLIVFEKTAPNNAFRAKTVAAWSEGVYPMDMAVADFNEDGNPDVVLAYLGTSACTLFLGDGMLGFRVVSLPNTAAIQSVGVDAADVNNDGHMDFVTAPYSPRNPIFINLGNGDGTFRSATLNTYASTGYWGLAVADFDSDGNADLAASFGNYLDFYRGKGDGTFAWKDRITDDNFYYCSIDNFDLDGDGIQDLVMGRYNNNAPYHAKGVAVFRGKGDWTFTYVDLLLGGHGWERSVVAAPNAIAQNREPAAVIQATDQQIDAGSVVLYDGSGSYDEDGQIVSYQWDFGDGDSSSEASAEHIYYGGGTYTVSLTVTDDKGATGSAQAQIAVKAIAVAVEINPRTLNLKSNGQWVQATLQLPDGYGDSTLEPDSVYLAVGTAIVPAARVEGLTVKFDRQAVINGIASSSDATVLSVFGKVNRNGGAADFQASGMLRTINPGHPNKQ